MTDLRFSDAHLHLTSGIPDDAYPDLGRAELIGSCTSSCGEWNSLKRVEDPRVRRFYGVHPWHPEEWTRDTADRLVSLLEEDPRAGVGEIGLDSRHGDMDDQIGPFTEQLRIASEMNRRVTIHMVRSEETVLRILRKERGNCGPVILHSFNGPESYIRPFAEAGCMFSISPRFLSKPEGRARDILSAIPGDRLLVETDAPFTPGDFRGMSGFLERISYILGESLEELSSLTTYNARRALDERGHQHQDGDPHRR